MQSVVASRLMSSRRGTIAVGVGAAVLAALVLLVYLNSYRESVSASAQPLTVLVAKNLIPRGTSGSVIATNGLFQTARVPTSQVKLGAISDPAALNGQVTLSDVYPGQQLTAADFSATATAAALASQLTGNERAITVSIDQAHGLLGHLQAGNRVDIYVAFPEGDKTPIALMKLLVTNVLVLAAPAGGEGGTVALRLNSREAARVAFASDNAKLWFALRPPAAAKPTKPDIVTHQSLLFGAGAISTGGGG